MNDSRKQEAVKIIQKFKELYSDKVPPMLEFCRAADISENKIQRIFGGYKKFLDAAGKGPYYEAEKEMMSEKMAKKFKAICSKKEQIQGFFRHTLDLNEMFERAGNPPSLKVSAQPDTHVKFMDKEAVNCYLRFLEYYKPHAHIIMGDFADCEGLSHWPSEDLEPRRIVPEMKQARELLERIIKATPNTTTRIFICGNHEHWINMALAKMPELFDGLAELGLDITIEKLLGLEKYGYEFFPLNHLVQIGRAHFTHGIYTASSHAKRHLDVFKTNIFYGHMHDTQQHNQTSVDGPMDAQSLGCLCRLDAKFLKGKPNNWTHSHGVFEFFKDGSFTYYVPKIIEGVMSFNGVVFNGNE